MRTLIAVLALALGAGCSNGPSPEPAKGPPAPASAPPTQAAPPTEAAPTTAAPATEAPVLKAEPPVEALKIAVVLTPEDQARAASLAGDILTDQVNRLTSRHAENALPYLSLAAGHPRAEVVGAALEAMSRTWRRTGSGDAQLVDADYAAVVHARLKSTDGRIRAGAVMAARLLITAEVPDEVVLTSALEMLKTGTPADQVAAAGLLMNVRDFQMARPAKGDAQGRIVAGLLAALEGAEPYVAAAVLDKLGRAAFPGIAQRDALVAAAQARWTQPNAGVQGTSALLIAHLARPADNEVFARLLLPGLKHPDAYVRAATAEALAHLAYRPAVHDVMLMLDVDAEAILTVGGFTGLDGQPGTVQLLLEGGQRMDAVALNALRGLSGKSFDFKGGVTRQSRDGLVAQAKAWYTKTGSKFPRP